MTNRITFDPAEDPTPEMIAAEQAALEQGEKLVSAQEEDRARKYEQDEAENEDVNLIDGKFKSQEDLLKAYKELQKKLGQDAPEEEEEPSEEQEEAPEEKEEEEEHPLKASVRKFAEISQRFDEGNGTLNEEDLATLTQMDSAQLVATYFQYHKQQTEAIQNNAEVQSQMADIRKSVGGDEAYGEMIQWAGSNLNQDEIDQFNAVVSTNNPAAIKYAVESLSNRWRGQEGYEAPLVTGKKATSKAKGFRSQAELARAIADPRYSTDPAYRQDVEEKLARSGDLL